MGQRPKYKKVQDLLLERILNGEWRPGDRLPSEMQIAEAYGVAYLTLRSAVSALVTAGRLRRIKGRGTFVVEVEAPAGKPSIGLLLLPNWHSVDPFYFPPIVTGFVNRAEQLDHQVHLADRTEPLLEFLRFRALNVSAVACVLLDHSDLMHADALLDKGVLVVAINHYGGARKITAVSPDNRGGSYRAVNTLIRAGHRRFAYLAGPRYNLDATERRRGAKRAIDDAGLPEHAMRIYEGGFLEDSGYERGRVIAGQRNLPTAVVCVSDLAAFGLLKSFREAGIRVPEQVSVCGFGDYRLAGYACPPLSTVRLPLEEIGGAAASALVRQLQGQDVCSESIPCPLVPRETIAPPRS